MGAAYGMAACEQEDRGIDIGLEDVARLGVGADPLKLSREGGPGLRGDGVWVPATGGEGSTGVVRGLEASYKCSGAEQSGGPGTDPQRQAQVASCQRKRKQRNQEAQRGPSPEQDQAGGGEQREANEGRQA